MENYHATIHIHIMQENWIIGNKKSPLCRFELQI